MYYRVFISEKGKFRNRDYYEYAAEFSERDFVAKTVRWIRKRKRFSEKDIIIIEAEHSEIDPQLGPGVW